MSGNGFDFSELDDWLNESIDVAKNVFPKETDKFLRKAGNKLASNMRRAYKTKVKKKTGNLTKGVGRGRPYTYNGNERQVRVYNKAPHAPLIEHGHVMADKNGKPYMENGKEKFVKGRNIAADEQKEFRSEFFNMAEEFVDEVLGVMK